VKDRLRALMLMPEDLRQKLGRPLCGPVIDLVVKAVELERQRITRLVNGEPPGPFEQLMAKAEALYPSKAKEAA
jgi:hypothetical protein